MRKEYFITRKPPQRVQRLEEDLRNPGVINTLELLILWGLETYMSHL
jgi:hypothetical protein